jgi:uncharacterized membrane protein YeiH
MDTVIFIIEIIGVIAFAASGAMRGILKQLDIIGIILLALITSFGGGVIRDIILARTPPALFVQSNYIIYTLVGVATALCCTGYAYLRKRRNALNIVTKSIILNVADAVGLGIFCITGAVIAVEAGYQDNFMLVLFVGGISGVGGGVLRDILVGEIPIIFRKYIYLIPSLLGTIAYYALSFTSLPILAMGVGVAIIITLRVLAIVFKWNLPIIKIED